MPQGRFKTAFQAVGTAALIVGAAATAWALGPGVLSREPGHPAGKPAATAAEALPVAAVPSPTAAAGEHRAVTVPVNGIDFSIEVPKLGYEAAVREGVGAAVLDLGPGHYPEMAWPGQGNHVAVAAHNTYWIRFGELGAGDEVVLKTSYGVFRYSVTGTRIVKPDDRTVLVPTGEETLTLTTCWPLWAGAWATDRLIIDATPAGEEWTT